MKIEQSGRHFLYSFVMTSVRRSAQGALAASASALCLLLPALAQKPDAVTVPMKVANNRAFIPITVGGPSGHRKTVWFWVDTGGGIVLLSGRLSQGLGLSAAGGSVDGVGDSPAEAVGQATLSIAGFALDMNGVGVAAHVSPPSRTAFAGVEAEGFLPARILSNYDVVFDYPHHRFSIGKSGSLRHRGVAVPLSVKRKSGFARVELDVEGTVAGFMVDTGAAYSGMSEVLISRMHTAHPAWPFQVGAIGPANMVGKQFDVENVVLAVPQVCLRSVCFHNTGFVSRPIDVYEKYMSQEMPAPIVGVLGGNLLSQFRLELDYPHQTAYIEQVGPEPSPAITAVGIIVHMRQDGAVEISGVVKQRDASEAPGLRPGDRLLKIDGHSVTGLPLSSILRLLSGKLGESRSLAILRTGQKIVIKAAVRKHLV